MKVSELEGEDLDYWVAKAADVEIKRYDGGFWYTNEEHPKQWDPSSSWLKGGPIIEREGIGLWKGYDSDSCGKKIVWEAATGSPVNALEITGPDGKGPTPLIAAMRAYVRLKFGKEVDEAPQTAG